MHIGQFKAVPVQMDRMRIVRLVVKDQPVSPALVENTRLNLLVVALTVDGPAIEAARAAVDLTENERNHFVRICRLTTLPEDRIVPGLLLRLDPTRLTALVRVFDDD